MAVRWALALGKENIEGIQNQMIVLLKGHPLPMSFFQTVRAVIEFVL
jgi:hypothetical protein